MAFLPDRDLGTPVTVYSNIFLPLLGDRQWLEKAVRDMPRDFAPFLGMAIIDVLVDMGTHLAPNKLTADQPQSIPATPMADSLLVITFPYGLGDHGFWNSYTRPPLVAPIH
ncbi:hypothetical protein ABVK25_007547 [Lepraria finkii]|uniref:Uncharacterized protein n=1 Tax=Lepraria finkii TaxID=1340010 RepID=A0ABR4B2Z6_9LECA